MKQHEKSILYPLYGMVRGRTSNEVIDILWRKGMLNRVALERYYFEREVSRRMREQSDRNKKRVMIDVARESGCSFEKVRAAIYQRQTTKN